MLLPVIFLVGLIAVGINRRSEPKRPGPIAVLGEFLVRGDYPPAIVIQCAIAEAETIGRQDLARDIIATFVAPVVYQAQLAAARDANAREEARAAAAPPPPMVRSRAPMIDATAIQVESAAASADAPIAADEITAPAPVPTRAKRVADDAALLAEAMGIPVDSIHHDPTIAHAPSPATGEMVAAVMGREVAGGTVAVLEREPSAPLAPIDGSDGRFPPSPLANVDDDRWHQFTEQLATAEPLFQTSRHIGRYRQNRDRLAELAIDPSEITGSATSQRQALDIELADAHKHAVDGGMIDEHLRRLIRVPGREDGCVVSLSGMLGVFHAAGLEGGCSWLENPADRKRYKHTTDAFLSCNGVF